MARRRHMSRGRYKMTPARRAALRKAQLASAKKRRRHMSPATKAAWRRRGRATVKYGGRAFRTIGATVAGGYTAYMMMAPEHREFIERKAGDFARTQKMKRMKYRTPMGQVIPRRPRTISSARSRNNGNMPSGIRFAPTTRSQINAERELNRRLDEAIRNANRRRY